MAGLVPAIHVFLACGAKDVDARHKAGHDDELLQKALILLAGFLSQALRPNQPHREILL